MSIVNAASYEGAHTPEEVGYVDFFESMEIGGDRVAVLRQLAEGNPDFHPSTRDEKTKAATVVLRCATANRLDDLERAVDGGVNVIKS